MKKLSKSLIIIGIILLIFAFSSDISVAGMDGGRVVNIGLMHDRLVYIAIGGMTLLAGVLLLLFGGSLQAQGNSTLQFIDELPNSQFLSRLGSALLVVLFAWLLVVMHIWPSMVAIILMLIGAFWFSFQPIKTEDQLKRLWFFSSMLSIGTVLFHVIGNIVFGPLALTFSVISAANSYFSVYSLLAIFGVMIFAPVLVSIIAFLYFRKLCSNSAKI